MRALRMILTLCFSLGLQAVAMAEFRPWSDTKGNAVEAEFVRMADETVVLRKRDGAEIKVPLASLCAEDHTYAMLQSPPKIEINVDDKVDRSNLGYTGGRRNGSQIRNDTVMVNVDLRKTSPVAYGLKLKLEVVLIGIIDPLDRYAILDSTTSTFEFTDENKEHYTLQCKPLDLRNVSGSRQTGREYEGYLVVVRDQAGKVVATKASRLEFEKNAEIILKATTGAVFDKQFMLIKDGKPDRKAAKKS